jgi:hypothetical protein
MTNSRTNEKKAGQGLISAIGGVALAAVLAGAAYLNHSREVLVREDYSKLPETNLVCNGEYVDAVTARGVDTDHFPREMRYDWFTKANPGKVMGNKIYGEIRSKYDPEYLAEKAREAKAKKR